MTEDEKTRELLWLLAAHARTVDSMAHTTNNAASIYHAVKRMAELAEGLK